MPTKKSATDAAKAAVKAGADNAGAEVANPVDAKIESYKSKQPSAPFKGTAKKQSTKRAPVTTVDQLRDESIRQNKPVTTEQLAQVREAEQKTLDDGGQRYRLPASKTK